MDNADWVTDNTKHIIAATANPLGPITFLGFIPSQPHNLPSPPPPLPANAFAGLLIKEFVNGGHNSDFIEISLPTKLKQVEVSLHGSDHFEPVDPQHPYDRHYRNGRPTCQTYQCAEAVIHHIEVYRREARHGRSRFVEISEATCPQNVNCDITFIAPGRP